MSDAPPKRNRVARPAAPAKAAAGAASPALQSTALNAALRQLMEPLAALALARGVPFVDMEEMLKTAFVDAARTAHPNLPSHRLVSRISTATGINRREVTRLTQPRAEEGSTRRSPATRVFTSWLADPALKTPKGEVMALPRQGPAPSFEALAQSVTRDVHPRSLLDELCRLGLAAVDGEADTVRIVRESFVPKGDGDRMLGFLGSNAGDHLRASVANILSDPPPHLEQAMFADGLSTDSVEAFRQLMRTQWKAVLAAAVPALQQLIDNDRAAGRALDQRVRLGMYTYNEATPAAPETAAAQTPTLKPKAASKPKPT